MVAFAAHEAGPLAQAQTFTKLVAGAETNVGVGLARLGLKVAWVSRLGADSFGAYMRDSVAGEGVDCSAVVEDPVRPTGFMLKSRALAGGRPDGRVLAPRLGRERAVAGGLRRRALPRRAPPARHRHHAGAVDQRGRARRAQHALHARRRPHDLLRSEPAAAPVARREAMAERLNRLAGLADWVLPGLAEGRTLTGLDTPEAIAAFYLDRGAKAVVVKLGADGAYWRTADREGRVPGVKVEAVVDTVGAGDGFAVGVISGRLEGLDWPAAVARGNWIGAQAVQVVGDMDGLPRRDELPADVH